MQLKYHTFSPHLGPRLWHHHRPDGEVGGCIRFRSLEKCLSAEDKRGARKLLQALRPTPFVQALGAGVPRGAEAAADLVRGDVCHPERDGLGYSRNGVVVGSSQNLDTVSFPQSDQLRRCVLPIGDGGVGVEVGKDAHAFSSSANSRS